MISTREDYIKTVNRATIARDTYYKTGEDSGLTDTEYDNLLFDIQLAGETNGWTEGDALINAVAGGATTDGSVQHDVRMLSLGKVQSLPDVEAFAKTVKGGVVFEPKLDGIAVSVKYVNGKITQVATRGDSRTGEDITKKALISDIKGLPHFLNDLATIEVRGEMFIGAKDFITAQEGRSKVIENGRPATPFANSRNAVSGSLRTSKDTSYVHMTFGAYDAYGIADESYTERMIKLVSYGFKPALTFIPKEVTKLPTLIERVVRFGEIRKTLDTPTDGVVIKADKDEARRSMGEGSRHPKWAVAFKFEAEQVTTVLNTIKRAVGRTGNISYVAQLDPVEVDGSVVAKATLNNATFIKNLDLHLGDTVVLRKANDIIPEIVSVVTSLRPKNAPVYVAPTTCPKCGNELDTTSSVIWKCHNPECAIINTVIYAVSRDILDVDNLSTAIIEKLFDANLIKDTADLFTLTQKQLATLIVDYSKDSKTKEYIIPLKPQYLGETMATKIFNNLLKAKQQPLNRVISSLGISKTGRTFGRRLASHFKTMTRLQNASINDLLQVEGIAEGRAVIIHKGLQDTRPLVEKMRKVGFTALSDTPTTGNSQAVAATPAASGTDKLKGMNIVVTGTIEGYSRTALTELIELHGGHASSSISSKTSFVVLGEKAGSKAAKAAQLNIPTKTPAEFFKML